MKIKNIPKYATWFPFDKGDQDKEADQLTNESNENEEEIQEEVKGE